MSRRRSTMYTTNISGSRRNWRTHTSCNVRCWCRHFHNGAYRRGGTDVVQLVYSSNLTWNPFTNTAIGSGSFNFSFLQDQFWTKANTASQQARLGLITTPNNWSVNGYQYNQIMYTHTLPGSWNWLSVTVGQYTFLAYDDNEYADNAQTTSSACRCRKAPHRPIQTGLLVHMLRPRSRMVSSPSREGSRELPTS